MVLTLRAPAMTPNPVTSLTSPPTWTDGHPKPVASINRPHPGIRNSQPPSPCLRTTTMSDRMSPTHMSLNPGRCNPPVSPWTRAPPSVLTLDELPPKTQSHLPTSPPTTCNPGTTAGPNGQVTPPCPDPGRCTHHFLDPGRMPPTQVIYLTSSNPPVIMEPARPRAQGHGPPTMSWTLDDDHPPCPEPLDECTPPCPDPGTMPPPIVIDHGRCQPPPWCPDPLDDAAKPQSPNQPGPPTFNISNQQRPGPWTTPTMSMNPGRLTNPHVLILDDAPPCPDPDDAPTCPDPGRCTTCPTLDDAPPCHCLDDAPTIPDPDECNHPCLT
ncbi:uncharacterized protein LOC135209678 [Macrobrachium nipponense]|uniref:uncharacterized protein LOC135209678 n=1 Tax=Macrobrachium nipponense TaxID=159736 RepID=UPI0030C800A5